MSFVGNPYLFFANALSLRLDGVDEYVNVPTDASLNFSTAMTASAWVTGAAGNTQATMISKWNGGAPNQRGWMMFSDVVTGEYMRVILSSDGTNTASTIKDYVGSQIIWDNSWHHVAFTWGASTLELYVDGVKDTSVTKTVDGSFSSIHASTSDAHLSAYMANGAIVGSSHMAGNLDEVAVFGSRLSDAQITELYNSTKPADLNGHSAAANLTSWWRVDGSTFSALADVKGGNDGTCINMEAGDYEALVP